MSEAFDTLFTQHALASYAKQLRLADLIGEAGAWEVDLPAGRLSFEGGEEFRIGLLGSYGDQAGTWRWVWANEAMEDLPETVTATAGQMRKIGAQKDIPEFTDSDTEADDTFCDRICLVTVGESASGAYYRGPYDGGAAYFILLDPLKEDPDAHKLMRLQRVIAEAVSTFDLPHRAAIEAYFASEGLVVGETDAEEIHVKAEDGVLRIRFDEQGRVIEMKSLLQAGKPKGGFFKRLFGRD